MIILYSNDCPRCKVLKQKLDTKGINYTINSNVDEMLSKGFTSVPMLEVNGIIYDFKAANNWIEEFE